MAHIVDHVNPFVAAVHGHTTGAAEFPGTASLLPKLKQEPLIGVIHINTAHIFA